MFSNNVNLANKGSDSSSLKGLNKDDLYLRRNLVRLQGSVLHVNIIFVAV